MPFAFSQIRETKTPLLHHFDNKGTHLFLQKTMVYILMQYLCCFMVIYFLPSNFSFKTIHYLPFLICCTILITGIQLTLRFCIDLIQKRNWANQIYLLYLFSIVFNTINFYALYQNYFEGNIEQKAINLMTMRVTSNLWMIMSITSYVQSDLKIINVSGCVQVLVLSSLVYMFIGAMIF